MAAWPAHTMGDIYVYFPKERTVATGDLYLTNSVPAMDEGSAAHWIQDLDQILALPADHFVPGHFEVGTQANYPALPRLHGRSRRTSRAVGSGRRYRRTNAPENSAAAIPGFPAIPQIRGHLRRQRRRNPQPDSRFEVIGRARRANQSGTKHPLLASLPFSDLWLFVPQRDVGINAGGAAGRDVAG